MNRPLSIMHLITELNTGGAEQMLYRLVKSSDRRRIKSIVVSMTDRGPLGEEILKSGIPVHELGMRLGRPDPRAIFKLIRLIKRESVDILQTWLYHSDFLGLLAGKIARVPRIVWGIRCSNVKFEQYRRLTALTMRICSFLSPLADAVIFNSHAGREVHESLGYNAHRMEVIPNGFDTSLFQPETSSKNNFKSEFGLSDQDVLIGMVARFDPMKDHRTFLKAASLLASQSQNVHFALIGKGMEPTNPKLTSEIPLKLTDRLLLLGQRNDMPRVMSGLDILTNSSFGEGFPNVIGEAMASETVCVVSDVGDSARIVGGSGIVVASKDFRGMAEAWNKLISIPEEDRLVLGNSARQRILSKFSIERVTSEYEDFYESL